MFLSPPLNSYLFVLPWTLECDGGVNQVVENLMNFMERHGDYRPLLMVNSWSDTSIRQQEIKGRHHFFFRLRSLYDAKIPLRNLIAFIIYLPFALLKINKFINSEHVAAINFHFCDLSAFNVSILKILGLFRGKLILSFHGADVIAAIKTKGLEKILYKILLKSADLIVTCSEQLKTEMISLNHKCSNHVMCIHNGIDVGLLANARCSNSIIDSKLRQRGYILNVATYEFKKGQDVLINAFFKISNLFPNIDMVIIGRPAESSHTLKVLIDSLALGHRVWLYENVPHDKILAFFQKAMIFALPSRYEPFGIVILEAGLFSIPVVATKVGGIPEILTHGQTGRLCDADDVEGLAGELTYLLENPDERAKIGQNLHQHVAESFTWEQAYLKYMKCVRGVL